jgi:hypothetical protein
VYCAIAAAELIATNPATLKIECLIAIVHLPASCLVAWSHAHFKR